MSKLSQIRQRVYRYLSRRAHSRYQLQQKLQRHAERDLIDQVLDEVEKAGYLNDSDFAMERALELRKTRHWGDLRIAADLKRHGINATIRAYVLSEVNRHRTQRECLRHVISSWLARKKRPRTLAQVKKLFDFCRRQGFSSALVRESIEPLFQGLEERSHEKFKRDP